MYKYILIPLFLLTSGLFAQDITATQKLPTSAMPGTEFTVETTVNRSKVNGFMKFFQEIPEGFTAAEIESKGGTFTFADGGAKIVWISPPSEDIFVISYKVTVDGGVSGLKPLPGKISYINNNERKIFDLPIVNIMIGIATAPVKKEIPSNPPLTSASTPPVQTTPATTTPVVAATPVKTPLSVQKETAPKTSTPATFTKVPTSALPSSSGKIYKVQIGAYAAKPKIEGVPEISTFVLENGITKYFSGSFTAYEDAVKRKKEMSDKGFQGAFIVAFENGKIVK